MLFSIRVLSPERPMDWVGFRALIDALFAVGLAFIVLFSSHGWGNRILKWLGLLASTSKLEQGIFSIPIGIGCFSYGVLALGLAGFLQPWIVLAWTGVFIVLGNFGLFLQPFSGLDLRSIWLRVNNENYSFFLWLSGILAFLGLINALSPVYDQDGLMYHLQGIRYFLDSGRITLLPEIWQANGPSTFEMVYILGLVTQSESFARLIHLTFSVLMVIATFSIGKRFFGDKEAFLAGLILAGIPSIFYLGSLTYTDFAWVLYSFLAVYAILCWKENGQIGWIILAGIFMGFALGSKYLAVVNLGVLIGWIILQKPESELKQIIRSGFLLIGCSFLVASPWYIKNWALSGNPVFPFVFGGPEWELERLGFLSTFLNSFGVGKTIQDFVLLPLNIFYRFDQFATLPFEIPSFIFILAPGFFWMKRSTNANSLAWITVVETGLWSLGSQQTRFLLPAYPGLSLMAAVVVNRWIIGPFVTLMKRVAIKSILISLTICQLIFIGLYLPFIFVYIQPFAVVTGFETKNSFLKRVVGNYSALQFIQHNSLSAKATSLFWDGAGYYCDRCNLATSGQWASFASANNDIQKATIQFQRKGVSFILYNSRDEVFFLKHDPFGFFRETKDFFITTYKNMCTREIYRDKDTILFELTCN